MKRLNIALNPFFPGHSCMNATFALTSRVLVKKSKKGSDVLMGLCLNIISKRDIKSCLNITHSPDIKLCLNITSNQNLKPCLNIVSNSNSNSNSFLAT